jgi:LytS/YehU family sensor histidine kinase
MTRNFQIQIDQNSFRGFDWAQWMYVDGQIKASYVFPYGTAASAGLHEGDVLVEFDYNAYFDEESFKSAIESAPAGSRHTYSIRRGNRAHSYDVRFTTYPIFLYPLSTSIWNFSVWGFFIVALIHLIALVIVFPLVRLSPKAQGSLALIIASSMAIIGNFFRIVMLMSIGANQMVGVTNDIFQALSIICLLGWITFPALLVYKVLSDREVMMRSLGIIRWVIFVPTVFYAILSLYTFFLGTWGPFAFKSLMPPVLFHVYLYMATATGLYLLFSRIFGKTEAADTPTWSIYGSLVVMLLSLLTGFSVLLIGHILPFAPLTDINAGWTIVCAQILTTAPILLVTQATLKYGKHSEVVSRYVSYWVGLAVAFLFFLGVMSFVTAYLDSSTHLVLGGLLTILLIVAFEQFVAILRKQLDNFLAAEAQRARAQLTRFGEQMIGILDHQALIERTLSEIMSGISAQFGTLVLLVDTPETRWMQEHDPETLFLNNDQILSIVAGLDKSTKIWSVDPELNEQNINRTIYDLLRRYQYHLLVPILGRNTLVGFVALGAKKRFQTVYNLSEIALLRTLCNQLGLANERIALIERERLLVKQHAEAELVALRAQINPHFLFNALNTLAALIDENPKEAEKNVEHLASIFRYTLKTGSKTFMPLSDEFSLVRHYLAIEQTRFGPNLVVEIHLDPALNALPIPAFAIQTVVENSIKHGIEKSRKRGTLKISATVLHEEMAEIKIEDTGAGIPHLFAEPKESIGKQSFFGIGLSNVFSRLEHLYHRNDLLRYRSSPDAGTTVRLLIPLSE